jgi:hypothetical protein
MKHPLYLQCRVPPRIGPPEFPARQKVIVYFAGVAEAKAREWNSSEAGK